jgi:phage shock protein B
VDSSEVLSADTIDLVVIFGFLFLLVVAVGYFRLQRVRGQTLSGTDRMALDRATEMARRLEQRVDSLERLLDADVPDWRRKVSG